MSSKKTEQWHRAEIRPDYARTIGIIAAQEGIPRKEVLDRLLTWAIQSDDEIEQIWRTVRARRLHGP